MEVVANHNMENIKVLNEKLLKENSELRKLVGLMQENMELRYILSGSLEKKDNQHSQPLPVEEKIFKACPEPQHLRSMERTVGEIAFQLDRRILAFVFQDRVRLYGISVSNITDKINELSTNRQLNKVDNTKRSEMMKRYTEIMNKLQEYGYDPKIHPQFSEDLVNTYGILKELPQPGSSELSAFLDPEALKRNVSSAVPASDLKEVHILLRCLQFLAKEDGKPLFVW
ncbi:speriolin-like protein [Microcaecilia unicolor]|uniref:Speriolin-like protein n=1 Tax=Microcaecilia unicolor TaxID=1415580 RepID=A0A6P7X0M4_9AMPH|nr:speriolin-like protein [Microcaecilia unicolor]